MLIPLLLTAVVGCQDGLTSPVQDPAHSASAKAIRGDGGSGSIVEDGKNGRGKGASPVVVVDLDVSSVATHSVALTFTEVSDGKGEPADYLVKYSKQPLNWRASAVSGGSCKGLLSGTTVGAVRTCSVHGLDAEAEYAFQLAAMREGPGNSDDWVTLSNIATGKTLPDDPPADDPPADDPPADDPPADDPPADDPPADDPPADDPPADDPPPPADDPATEAPGKVTNLAVFTAGEDWIELGFTEVDDGTRKPARYDVRFAKDEISWGSAQSVAEGSCRTVMEGTTIGLARRCKVRGLQSNSKYQVQLVAFRGTMGEGAEYGPLSNVARGETSQAADPPADDPPADDPPPPPADTLPPGYPGTPTFALLPPDSIVASWTASDPPADAYEVWHDNVQGKGVADTTFTNSIVLEALDETWVCVYPVTASWPATDPVFACNTYEAAPADDPPQEDPSPPPPGVGTPAIEISFDGYSNTAELQADGLDLFHSPGVYPEAMELVMDAPPGLGLSKSMRYDHLNTTGWNPGTPHENGKDVTISRSLYFQDHGVDPTRATEIWVEYYIKFSANWDTYGPATGNADHKTMFILVNKDPGQAGCNRVSMKFGVFGDQLAFGLVAGRYNQGWAQLRGNVAQYWNEQWHQVRMHLDITNLTSAGYQHWIDGRSIGSASGLDITTANDGACDASDWKYFYGMKLGANLNQGADEDQWYQWNRVRIWLQDPGW